MTNKEANEILVDFKRNGYIIKTGHCCYQDDNMSTINLIKLGYNSGAFGWNWSMFLHPTEKIVYISNYRNSPSEAHN